MKDGATDVIKRKSAGMEQVSCSETSDELFVHPLHLYYSVLFLVYFKLDVYLCSSMKDIDCLQRLPINPSYCYRRWGAIDSSDSALVRPSYCSIPSNSTVMHHMALPNAEM